MFETQFNHEKSDQIGLKIIDNFINLWMKYFLCVMLVLLYACESTNEPKDIKKKKSIQMKVTTEPSIKAKKWKYSQL